MLLGNAVLGSHPLASLGIDPAFGASAALTVDDITSGPQYPAGVATGPRYESTVQTTDE